MLPDFSFVEPQKIEANLKFTNLSADEKNVYRKYMFKLDLAVRTTPVPQSDWPAACCAFSRLFHVNYSGY